MRLESPDPIEEQPKPLEHRRAVLRAVLSGVLMAGVMALDTDPAMANDTVPAQGSIELTAEFTPRYAIEHFDSYKHLPNAEALLEYAVYHSAIDTPWVTLELIGHYSDRPYARDVMVIAATGKPRFALFHLPRFQSMPWAKDLLEIIALKIPKNAVDYALENPKNPASFLLLSCVAEVHPTLVLKKIEAIEKIFGERAKHLFSHSEDSSGHQSINPFGTGIF
jgi:hypothetical protein